MESILLIILLVITISMGIWCVVNPESVREFYRNHPKMDRYHRTENSSDISLRITGVALIILGIFGLVFLGILLF